MHKPKFAPQQEPQPQTRPTRPPRVPDAPDASGPLWVCYFRVSTTKQGESGLGLDAQREAVARYTTEKGGAVLAEFTEVESGKKAANRPELLQAIDLCRRKKATLVIAKLDRLARSVSFIANLMESGVNFVAVDQPRRDPFMYHLVAAFAEEESRRISQRTKEALAAAKRRGVDVGATGRALAQKYKAAAVERAKQYAPLLAELRTNGVTKVREVCAELNRRGVPSPGGGRWHLRNTHTTMRRVSLSAK